MKAQEIAVSEFKAKCLGLVEQVAASGRPIVITKRGRPVAQLMPAPKVEKVKSIIGLHEGQGRILGDLINENEADAWEHMR